MLIDLSKFEKYFSMIFPESPIPHYSWIDNNQCVAGFSTRKGGVSSGIYESMNVGLHSKDKPENVRENRARFFNAVAPGFKVVNLHQIHSAKVVRVDSSFINDTEADGFYTTERNILLTISIADCGSVIFHDKDFSIIAGLHCGWRGTRDGIIQNMISELSKFVNPQDLTAYIGPMIQKDSYEVGQEFRNYFPEKFLYETGNSLHFDLNARVESILKEENVGTIYNAKLDTFTNPNLFFSYRRDGQTGRMCSFIGKK